MNWRYKAYNAVVSDIFTQSDEAFAMLLLENDANDYVKMIEIEQNCQGKRQNQSLQRICALTKSLGGDPV